MATSMAYAMVTKLSIALVEMDKMGKIGKMAIKMGEVSTVGLPIGVRIGGSTQPRSAAGGGKMGKISGVIGRTFGLVHGENSGEHGPGRQRPPAGAGDQYGPARRAALAGWSAVASQVVLTYTAPIVVALAPTDADRPALIRSPKRVLAHCGDGLQWVMKHLPTA